MRSDQEIRDEVDAETVARAGALLQFGADMTIATALIGFSTLLWASPGTGESGSLWDNARMWTTGVAGIWSGVAAYRFQIAWRQATKQRSRLVAFIMAAVAAVVGIATILIVMDYAERQNAAAACERAEAVHQTQILEQPVCKRHFAARAARDFRLFQPLQ